MAVDKKVSELEGIVGVVESEKSFDKAMANFNRAVCLVKEIVADSVEQHGKILEVMKDVDDIVERSVKIDCRDDVDDE